MQGKATPKRVRADGVPNLYRRPKDDVYEVGFTGSDGKWHIKTLGSPAQTLTEAKRAMRVVLGEVDRSNDVAPSKETFSRVARDLFDTMREDNARGEGSARTLALYEQRFRTHVEPTLGARRVQGITPDDIAKLLREVRAKGLSSWTCHGVLTLLGAVFNHAHHEMRLITASPTRGLSPKQKPKPRNKQEIRVLTGDEVAKLIKGAWPTWRTFITTAVYTGARASEILGLRGGNRRRQRRGTPSTEPRGLARAT